MADVSPSRRDYWILALLILGAAIVRLVGLTRESFWSDETFSAQATLLADPAAVIEYAKGDVHPPGYFLSLWAWTRLFGNSEYSIRLLSAVGGILMVPTVFRLGRQLFNVRTGLLAAFLSAFLIQSVYFSQEARAYSWLATLSVLAVSLAVDYRGGNPGRLVLLLGTTIALAYLHYFGLLMAILVWTFLLLFPGARSRLPVVAYLAAFVACFVPWMPHVLAQRSHTNWIPAPDAAYVAQTFNVYYGPGLPVDMWAMAFLLAGIPLALGKGTVRFKSAEFVMFLWILVPLMTALALSVLLRPIYSPRNMLIGAGGAILLLARAIEEVGARTRGVWIPAALFIIGVYGIHFTTGKGYFLHPTKQQIREAAQFVLERRSGNLPVYTVGWDRINFAYYFHLAGRENELRVISERDLVDRGLAASVPEQEFWIASAGINVNLYTNLRRDFDVLESGEYLEARSYHLRKKHP